MMYVLLFLMLTLCSAGSFLRGGSDAKLGRDLLTKLEDFNDLYFDVEKGRGTPYFRDHKNIILEEVNELIQQGADVNVPNDDGVTGLMLLWPMLCNPDPVYDEVLKNLVKAGVDTGSVANWGSTIFANAADSCYTYRLLDNGIFPAANDSGALEQAVAVSEPKRLERLLDAGLNADLRIWENMTALMMTAGSNNLDCTNVVLKHLKAIDHRDSDGQSALHYAFNGIGSKLNSNIARNKHSIILSLAQKISINDRDNEGQTPLIHAIKEMHAHDEQPDQKLIDLVISLGADPIQKDNYGLSALHYASHKRLDSLILSLFEALRKFAPEKLLAAMQEVSEPQARMVQAHNDGVNIKDHLYTAFDFGRNILAVYGFYRLSAMALCQRKR